MMIQCPKDRSHDSFSVTAHVTQLWKVDKDGEFIESIKDCIEVTHRPDSESRYVCETCGEEAVVIQ